MTSDSLSFMVSAGRLSGRNPEIFSAKLLTTPQWPCSARPMTQRNIRPQTLKAMSQDVPVALLSFTAAALVLVLVLITVQTGAGVGFA
ncbi:hypothetical protein M2650_12915 [Luteimonas sp. SX5]|uniref:Uncharacterized protein n=1 Tax=Luteimonas galliterrae TaxID=2940486 RepID=A0ABT0MMR7_9GAMM|nr:hypothetical protein [Luteimonas galliterrae]